MKKAALGAIASIAIVVSMVVMADTVGANGACSQAELSGSSFCQGATTDNFRNFSTSITNMLLFIIGTAAVIMIIIGGIKYATADGDASKIASAKNNILYSVIGLIVAIMAWGIVTFVIDRTTAGNTGQSFTPTPSAGTPAGGNGGAQQGTGGAPSSQTSTSFRHCVTSDRQFCVQERGVANAQACQALAVQRAGSNASSFYENGTCFRDRDP